MKLEWNVYWYDPNAHKMTIRNVFNLSTKFQRELDRVKEYLWDEELFSRELNAACAYCFWAKCEHEIQLSPWPSGEEKEFVKIDVYHQLKLNWDKFVDYVRENI